MKAEGIPTVLTIAAAIALTVGCRNERGLDAPSRVRPMVGDATAAIQGGVAEGQTPLVGL